MARFNEVLVTLEFEPVVKLRCKAFGCKNNLVNATNMPDGKMACCNLKQILISDNGQCANFEALDVKRD